MIFAFQLERHFFCVIRVRNFQCAFYANLILSRRHANLWRYKPVFWSPQTCSFHKNLYFLKTYTNRLPLPHFITRIFITSIVIHFMPLWKHHFCYVRETILRCKWHVMFNNTESPQCLRSDGIVIIGFRWHKLQDRLITVLSLRITAVFRSCNVLCYVVSSTCSNAEISGTQRRPTPCMVFSLPWRLYEVPAARILLLESLFSFIFGCHHTYKLYKISW